ncbi:MAG: membrane protein insertase YidC [Bacteroidia bacterium]|nr:membrane protein insertase YidC [Bacteroidia bacterium]
MDRNSIIGLSLIFLIVVGWGYFSQPSPEELALMKRQQDSVAMAEQMHDSLSKVQKTVQQIEKKLLTTDTLLAKSKFGSFASNINGQNSICTLENKELRIKLASKGGKILSVELKNYKKFDKKSPLILFDELNNKFNYSLTTLDGKQVNTEELYFVPSAANVTASNTNASLSFIITLADGQTIEQVYSLKPEGFLVDYSLKLNGMNEVLAAGSKTLPLEWNILTPNQEKNPEVEGRNAAIYYHTGEEVKNLSETKDEELTPEKLIRWVSFKDQYFNASLIAAKPEIQANLKSSVLTDSNYLKKYEARLAFPYAGEAQHNLNFQFFFGPNQYKTLEALNIDLEKIIPLGWLIFRWMNKYVIIHLFNLLTGFIGNYGLVILLMTLVIKLILFPLVYKSFLSTIKMRLLKPEMDEIKAKLGDDPQQVQMENMKLFRQAGVSPMGGCVPVLLQMPVLIAMFSFFPAAFELRQQEFLWATDLSSYDSIFEFSFSIPFYGNHVSLFTLLMTISTLIYTYMNNQMTGVTGQMKWIGYMMPIVFLGVFNNYAAGLSYYYFVSNMITFAQQWGIRQFVDEKALHAQIQENKKKPVQKSKFQQRLEEMAQQKQQPKKPIKK